MQVAAGRRGAGLSPPKRRCRSLSRTSAGPAAAAAAAAGFQTPPRCMPPPEHSASAAPLATRAPRV